ncbi:Halomucin, partial [Trichinella pseudospiralis]
LLYAREMSRALLSSFVLVVQLLIFVISKRQTTVIIKLPSSCKEHSDCQPYQALCVKNECKAAAPARDKNGDGIYCDENNDECASDQACLYGICFEEYKEEKDSTSTSQSPKPDGQCRMPDDCNVRQVCVKKKCEKAKPTKEECERHKDCNSNNNNNNNEQACWYGICWELFDEVASAPSSSTSGNKVCISGKCVDAEPMSKCRKDEDCAQNSICKNGVCFKLTKENYCSNHEQCSGRKLCDENSTCQDATLQTPLKLCDDNKHCTKTAVCKTGYCWIFKKDSESGDDENEDKENGDGDDDGKEDEEDNSEKNGKDEEDTKDDDEEKKANDGDNDGKEEEQDGNDANEEGDEEDNSEKSGKDEEDTKDDDEGKNENEEEDKDENES